MKELLLVLLAGSFAAASAVPVAPFCEEDKPFDGSYFQLKMKEGTTCSLAPLSAKISHCRVPGEDILYATTNNILKVGNDENVTALSKGNTEGICFESADGRGKMLLWRMRVY